ncbi:MAG TPA: NAD(P)-binding domain-containing protein [Candidatus Sulfotelmatobacter sp.]
MAGTQTKARRNNARHKKAKYNQRKATVFLGGGRITSALIAGVRLAGYERPIMVHDHNAEKLRALRRGFHIEVAADLKSALARAETLILAVRPSSVADLLDELKRSAAITRSLLAVSLAAGIPLKKLRAKARTLSSGGDSRGRRQDAGTTGSERAEKDDILPTFPLRLTLPTLLLSPRRNPRASENRAPHLSE